MTTIKTLKYWPPVGLLAMTVLGLVVGRGSTRLDDWFAHAGKSHDGVDELLFFTKPVLLAAMLLAALAVASFQRRWRVAAVVALTPVVGLAAVRILKPLFERGKGGGLAYPSGHVTVMVAVVGMIVLVLGARVWVLVSAAVFALLGLIGQALTYHYFTDTIGAALLASALVCLGVRAAGLDRCQPRCDLDHSSG
jgi:membrane-associated phospholipid phosphatase